MYKRSLFVKQTRPKPPKKRLIRYILWTAFKRLLMLFGAMFLLSVLSGVIMSFVILGSDDGGRLPDQFVLRMRMESGFIEHENAAGAYGFKSRPYLMREVTEALDAAAVDKRVKGLLVTMSGGAPDLVHIQEFHKALDRFRAAGKFAWIYAPEYGAGMGLGEYYFASGFDQIWMQPMGTLSVTGVYAEQPFARDALDKIGVEPQFFARKEYKNLFESFTSQSMSEASRTTMTSLIDDLTSGIIGDTAARRSMEPAALRVLVNKGLFVDREALDAGLIDRLEDYQALRRQINLDLTGKPELQKIFVKMEKYTKISRTAAKEKNLLAGDRKTAALVYVTGVIASESEMANDSHDTAEDIAYDIVDMSDEEDIDIIVLRIDSPGGSPAAAETIRNAILTAKSNGKKVIVSMGGMAASGGYWVAAPADRIFTMPGTLTGSIGVAGGKFSLAQMWAKLGINWEGIQYGDNADMWSFNEPFSEGGRARMNAMMDAIYDGFVQRVAEGRGMSFEQADNVARGRVWTGRQAVANGLADDIGGLDDALDYAAAQIGLTGRADMDVEIYPRPLTPIERILELMGSYVGALDTIRTQAAVLEDLGPLLEHYRAARMREQFMVWQPPVLQ